MTSFANRHVLLLAALVAAAAGVCFFNSHKSAPAPEQQYSQDQHGSISPHFATMRSARPIPAEKTDGQEREQWWEEALNAPDRCKAMATSITNTETAQEAMRWAKNIDDETMRKMAEESILCAWLRYDPHAAANWALNVVDDAGSRAFALTSVFERWAAQDAKAASDYAITLEQSDQTYAIAAVAPALAGNNPQEAIKWAQSFGEEDARDLATHYVVTTWARNQPSEAAAWVTTEPEGFGRADDVRTIVEKWLETDATATVEWATKLPAGSSRDSAFDLISSRFADNNPSLAAAWGASIDRTELRDARLEGIAGKWLNTDPDGARSWLETSTLPDAAKAKLLAPPPSSSQ
ncbi:MAG: hypothetical protein ACXWKG_10280 [Limisphaerales bacterium]